MRTWWIIFQARCRETREEIDIHTRPERRITSYKHRCTVIVINAWFDVTGYSILCGFFYFLSCTAGQKNPSGSSLPVYVVARPWGPRFTLGSTGLCQDGQISGGTAPRAHSRPLQVGRSSNNNNSSVMSSNIVNSRAFILCYFM